MSTVLWHPRVLLAEDDAETRRLLREALEAEGIVVVGEAADGAEAVGQVWALDPDIVVIDLRMPRMGGIEATRVIKESFPLIQVLILTAYDGPLPTRSAQEVGAYAYLVKGCSTQLLRDVILQAWKFKAGLDKARLA